MYNNSNDVDILSAVTAYDSKGTHLGARLNAGNNPLLTERGQFSSSLPIGNLFAYTICPTYSDDAFNTGGAASFPANSTTYMSLSDLTPPAGKTKFLEKVIYGDTEAIKMDYSRPLTINSDQPFEAMISGFDRMGEKMNMLITGELVDTVYKSTCLRAVSYLTSIRIQNLSGSAATITVELDKIIEIPYLFGAAPMFNFVWGWVSGKSIPYVNNFVNLFSYRGGAVTGGNSAAFNSGNSLYIPTMPSEGNPWDTIMTQTTGGPRFLYSLSGLVGGDTNPFEFDQTEVYTLFFSTQNPYENALKYPYLDAYEVTPEEWLLGLKNYYDDEWSAWKG